MTVTKATWSDECKSHVYIGNMLLRKVFEICCLPCLSFFVTMGSSWVPKNISGISSTKRSPAFEVDLFNILYRRQMQYINIDHNNRKFDLSWSLQRLFEHAIQSVLPHNELRIFFHSQVMDGTELQGWAERASFGGLLVGSPSHGSFSKVVKANGGIERLYIPLYRMWKNVWDWTCFCGWKYTARNAWFPTVFPQLKGDCLSLAYKFHTEIRPVACRWAQYLHGGVAHWAVDRHQEIESMKCF